MLEGVHELDGALLGNDESGLSGELVDSLCVDLDSLDFGLSLFGVILSDSSLEGLSALGLSDVLNSDVDSLRNDFASVLLVDHETDGVLGHIEDSSGHTVIELMGHTLVDGTISDNIDVVSLSVGSHDL